MPRVTGFNKDAVRARNRVEDASFSLRCVPDELALIRLRNVQAMERDGSLRDLLGPAVDELDFVLKLVDDAVRALAAPPRPSPNSEVRDLGRE